MCSKNSQENSRNDLFNVPPRQYYLSKMGNGFAIKHLNQIEWSNIPSCF